MLANLHTGEKKKKAKKKAGLDKGSEWGDELSIAKEGYFHAPGRGKERENIRKTEFFLFFFFVSKAGVSAGI